MEPTTPIGSRRIEEVCVPSYSAWAMPVRTRAAPAKNRTLSMEPGTSNSVVSLIGLPDWAVSTCAYSSARASIRSARASSAADRSPGVARDQPG